MSRIKNLLNKIREARDYDNTSGEAFWGNVGAGVLVIAKDTGRILIAMRSAEVNEPHTWGIVGGALDEIDSDIKTTAEREFKEETRYSGRLNLIPAYVFKSPGGGFSYHNFIGLAPHEFVAIPDWETDYFEWVSFEELLSIEPKHFGLENVLKDRKSLTIIKKYAQ